MNTHELEAVLVDRRDELHHLQRQQAELEIAQLELAARIGRKMIEAEDAEIAYELAKAGA